MANKSFKKFAQTGRLKDVITSRRKHQKANQLREGRLKRKGGKKGGPGGADEDEEEDDEAPARGTVYKGKKPMGADDMVEQDEEDEDEYSDDLPPQEDDEDDEEDNDDKEGDDTDDDFASVDDLEELEESHKQSLSSLQKKDPEFYKYLLENDKDLLNFGQEEEEEAVPKKKLSKQQKKDEKKKAKAAAEAASTSNSATSIPLEDIEEYVAPASDDEDDEEPVFGESSTKGDKTPEKKEMQVVTKALLRSWQKAMIEQRSLKSLRRLILAFRAASYSNAAEEGTGKAAQEFAYEIEEASVFNKVVITALKYTPVVLAHHVPFKTLPNGRFKVSKQPAPQLQKLIISHFSNVLHLLTELPSSTGESEMLRLVITESTRLLPWVITSKKLIRNYVKTLLAYWSDSGAADEIKIASFVAVRKVASAAFDDATVDQIFKSTYSTLTRSFAGSKNTNIHTLPHINLLKNSATSLFLLPGKESLAYQHAFTAIRALAVSLRAAMKARTKEGYKEVYSWQFVHSVQFWAGVIGAEEGGEGELKGLGYPLVQVGIGAVRLIPTSRYFPLHFQLISTLQQLSQKTSTYIPLSPLLLSILSSAEFSPIHKPKPSTLPPIDFEYSIRASARYPRTRVYQEGLAEEIAYLLLETQAGTATSVAYPEMAIPVATLLKKHIKKSKSAKVNQLLKILVEKMEANIKWVEAKRKNVDFSPSERGEVERFSEGLDEASTPLGVFAKLQRKVRAEKRREVEKAAREERGPEEDDDNSDEEDVEMEDEVEEEEEDDE